MTSIPKGTKILLYDKQFLAELEFPVRNKRFAAAQGIQKEGE
jgi:hypothetical protein